MDIIPFSNLYIYEFEFFNGYEDYDPFFNYRNESILFIEKNNTLISSFSYKVISKYAKFILFKIKIFLILKIFKLKLIFKLWKLI